MWKTCGQLAKEYGVTRITIGNWIRAGKYPKVERTQGGHYRVWMPHSRTTLGYSRASSSEQSSSLDAQERLIRSKYPGIEVLRDVGSGFNFRRQNFRSILERSLRGDAIEVVVSSRDRLARSGFEFVRWAIELHGGKVVELEECDGHEEFNSAELVSFITYFIASYHGKRPPSHRSKKSKSVSE